MSSAAAQAYTSLDCKLSLDDIYRRVEFHENQL